MAWLKRSPAYTPSMHGYTSGSTRTGRMNTGPWFCAQPVLPLRARHLPRAPLPGGGITSFGAVSSTASADVTRPSSLLRAHAPHPMPPADLGHSPYTAGLCRLLRAPAGRGCFPTLSLQSLPGCLDPYPAVLLRCSRPFLPEGLRPHVRSETFGAPDASCTATSAGWVFSGLQSFHYVQAPRLARPPGCSHRCGPVATGRPGRLHHAMVMGLPSMNCGIATCLNRAIGMAGLSPAGLQPCRPLH